MIEWNPFSTAPRDGTPILVYGEGGWATVYWSVALSCWVDTVRHDMLPWEPTHWAHVMKPRQLFIARIEQLDSVVAMYIIVTFSDGRTLYASRRHLDRLQAAMRERADAYPLLSLCRASSRAASLEDRIPT